MLRVKICGLTRQEDARIAAESGADYLGAVLSEGFSRSVAPELAHGFPTDVARLVAVLVDEELSQAVRLGEASGARILQLHGDEPPELVARLRDEGPWSIWKALSIRSADDLQSGLEVYRDVVDGILLEGWHPERGGGRGASFPWKVVTGAPAERSGDLTWVVAGGLTPDNVAAAVRELSPDVVDVSSGVEARPGEKDPEAVRAFIRNAREAEGS